MIRPAIKNNTDLPIRVKRNEEVVDTKRPFSSTATLEGILGEIKNEISRIVTTDYIPPNLSRSERILLRELSQDKNLVIQKCDKGADIVVQNRSDYVRDGLNHLRDPVTYRELSGDPTNSLCNNITKFLLDLYNDGLLNKESIYLCAPPENARLARLYFLKKTHKKSHGNTPDCKLVWWPNRKHLQICRPLASAHNEGPTIIFKGH